MSQLVFYKMGTNIIPVLGGGVRTKGTDNVLCTEDHACRIVRAQETELHLTSVEPCSEVGEGFCFNILGLKYLRHPNGHIM